MRLFILFLLLYLNTLSAVAQIPAKLPQIKANLPTVSIRDGEDFQEGQWTIMPDLKPDEYTTKAFPGRKQQVVFYTDVDSISCSLEPGQHFDFVILLKNKKAWTRIKCVENIPHAVFSEEYITANKGKYATSIPEVQELVHIIMALTPTGIKDSNMVEHRGAYYSEVMAHFKPFSKHPVVGKVDTVLIVGYYGHLKMDACGMLFNEQGKIVKHPEYHRLNWGDENLLDVAVPLTLLQDFAEVSGFRKFYKDHAPEYQRLLQLMEEQVPVRKQWDWLEQHFPSRYQNYWITFSPLVNGWHTTNRFESNGFKQSVMFVCGPIETNRNSKSVNEGLMTRVVFTEIDHNYVNPVSDKFEADIRQRAMPKPEVWATAQALQGYSNAYMVFNEYMTWAVFTCYAWDHFDEKDFKKIRERVELQMTVWRGFPKFAAFNEFVLELYQKGNIDFEKMYPEILSWCANIKQ
jgi:hypothetical protein